MKGRDTKASILRTKANNSEAFGAGKEGKKDGKVRESHFDGRSEVMLS